MITYLKLFLENMPAFLIGLALVEICWGRKGLSDGLIKLAVSVGIGWGVASCLFFFWSLFESPLKRNFIWFEIALALTLSALAVWSGRQAWQEKFQGIHRISVTGRWIATLGILGILMLTTAVLWQQADARPNGNFDAYAMWNLRARFIYLSQPDTWQQAFSPQIDVAAHVDYPLLWPLILLRAYLLQGRIFTQAGIFQAVVFGSACVLLMMAALQKLRDGWQALGGGILLLGMPWFLTYNAFQQSDGPLAYYYLIFCALCIIYQIQPYPGLLFLAGLATGLAGWTKNDGIMFLAAATSLTFIWILTTQKPGRLLKSAWFAAGLFLPLITLLIFKINLAPPSELFTGQTIQQLAGKIVDLHRWLTIGMRVGKTTIAIGGEPVLLLSAILIYIFMAGWHSTPRIGWQMLILFLTLVGYLGIYLITPYSLEWHLQYSLDRLLFHLFIPLLFLIFAKLRSPAELWQIARRYPRGENVESLDSRHIL